jgi:hypothetical protein
LAITYTRYDTTFAKVEFMPCIVKFTSDRLERLVDVAFQHCSYDLREVADLRGWAPVPRLGYQQNGVYVTVYEPL